MSDGDFARATINAAFIGFGIANIMWAVIAHLKGWV